MSRSTQPKTWARLVNGLAALGFGSFVLINYWPLVRLFDLARADLRPSRSVSTAHAPAIKTPGKGS